MAEVEKMTLSVSFEEKWEFLATFWIKNREKLQPSAREALNASHRSASKKIFYANDLSTLKIP